MSEWRRPRGPLDLGAVTDEVRRSGLARRLLYAAVVILPYVKPVPRGLGRGYARRVRFRANPWHPCTYLLLLAGLTISGAAGAYDAAREHLGDFLDAVKKP